MPKTFAVLGLIACLLAGCSSAVQTQVYYGGQQIPKPVASKNEPGVIRLVISIRKGNIFFSSPSQPEWNEIHVGPDQISMTQDGQVLLRARQVEWSFGQSTISLQNASIILTKYLDNGGISVIVFSPNSGLIHVTRDGVFEKNVTIDHIDIDANSGKVIWY